MEEGSPPRVWGKQNKGNEVSDGRRFTPTCVGKTCPEVPRTFLDLVHPHVCGENALMVCSPKRESGSPPRVWGKRSARYWQFVWTRFTPTCVGKTHPFAKKIAYPAVHPHVCGENPSCTRTAALRGGSPPRVWGKLYHVLYRLLFRRFTPTCVGKTQSNLCQGRQLVVHPHVCGENLWAWLQSDLLVGSPPRVWGKLCCPVLITTKLRFTPTCVGKTGRTCGRAVIPQVHPHVCGENS